MSGAEIAAEVAEAIREAGAATGDGPLICTFRRKASGANKATSPWEAKGETDALTPDAPIDTDVAAVQSLRRAKDASGALTDRFDTYLTVEAGSFVPDDGDMVAVGVAKADVDDDTVWRSVIQVHAVAPGGTDLLYKVHLAD